MKPKSYDDESDDVCHEREKTCDRDRSKALRGIRFNSSTREAFAGAGAGIISKTIVAPIERVKLLIQLRDSLPIGKIYQQLSPQKVEFKTIRLFHPFSPALQVARAIYHHEGILAFWRGNTPNVIRHGGSTALNFMFMDWYKVVISQIYVLPSMWFQHEETKGRGIVSSLLSGGLAGGTTTTILYPIEFLRTRLALDVNLSSGKKYTRMYPGGMRDVFCSIWKTDGIRGIYQGYGIALVGVVLYRGSYLGGYDAMKTEIVHRRSQDDSLGQGITVFERFGIAQVVSFTAGTICYPIDSVRRRLMMQAGLENHIRPYKSALHAFRKIFVEEGLRGFYLGIAPNLIRSLGGALLLVTYDEFKGFII